jgi:hypothetical protein
VVLVCWRQSAGSGFHRRTTLKKNGSRWRIEIPMRCQNLAGAVEVVLRNGSAAGDIAGVERLTEPVETDSEWQQLSGCTSPRTTITFTRSNPKI